MNILTAPLLFLAGQMPQRTPTGGPPPSDYVGFQIGQPFEAKGCFLLVSSLLAIAMIFVGLYLSIFGGSDNIEISGMGIELKTQTAGIGLAALGAIFYLIVGKMIMGGDE